MKLNVFAKMFFNNADECADFLRMGRKYFKRVATKKDIVQTSTGGWTLSDKVYFLDKPSIMLELGGCYTANTGDESNEQISKKE